VLVSRHSFFVSDIPQTEEEQSMKSILVFKLWSKKNDKWPWSRKLSWDCSGPSMRQTNPSEQMFCHCCGFKFSVVSAALLLQGLWCVVTVAAAAIIAATEAREKKGARLPKHVGKMWFVGVSWNSYRVLLNWAQVWNQLQQKSVA
jgi:hypothetical protein